MTYSKKMKSVARSTTQTEYVGTGEATKGRPVGTPTTCRIRRKGGPNSAIIAWR
jgi:hypothetical protein